MIAGWLPARQLPHKSLAASLPVCAARGMYVGKRGQGGNRMTVILFPKEIFQEFEHPNVWILLSAQETAQTTQHNLTCRCLN